MTKREKEIHRIAYEALKESNADEAEKYKQHFWQAFITDNKKTVAPWPVKNKWWQEDKHIQAACKRYKALEGLMIELKQRSNLRKPQSCWDLFDGTRYECDREKCCYAVLRKNCISKLARVLEVSEPTIKRLIAELVRRNVLRKFNLGGKEGNIIAVGYYEMGIVRFEKSNRGKDKPVYGHKTRMFLNAQTAYLLKDFKVQVVS